MSCPSIEIGSKALPLIGLGTWRSAPGEVTQAVSYALKECGYRHIDAAWSYGNEREVAMGIAQSGVKREDLWLTSKLFNNCHRPKHVEMQLRESLKLLDTDYLDLYLMHWPIAFDTPEDYSKLPERFPKRDAEGRLMFDQQLTEDFMTTYKAMEECVDKGLTRNIGVSNFTVNKLKKLLKEARIKPVANQVEINFAFPQPELVQFCKENGILVQAYAPLGSQGATLRDDPTIKKFAEKYNCDPANILLSWLVKKGLNVLPKSVTDSRIATNIKYIQISDEDVKALDEAATSKEPKRLCNPKWGRPDVDPFEEGQKYPWSMEIK